MAATSNEANGRRASGIMATTNARVKLSEQRQGGAFKCIRKMIGGRVFFLTRDRGDSERIALALAATWDRLRAAGSGWTHEAVASAMSLAGATPEPSATPTASGLQRVRAAVDDYLTEYRPRVSPGRYFRHVAALSAYTKQQADVPLGAIDAQKIAATINHFCARPRTARGTVMSVSSVQVTLKAILAFLDWCDLSGRWVAPRRFERMFRVKYSNLRTPQEVKRFASGPDVFTVNELAKLWRAASQRQRLYLGLALNTGETACGLAELLKEDFHPDGTILVLDRHRGKTGVRGAYPLWPEVAGLVAAVLSYLVCK